MYGNLIWREMKDEKRRKMKRSRQRKIGLERGRKEKGKENA